MPERCLMVDRYKSFNEPAANERLDIDYRIRALDRGSEAVILVPHGGWIEPKTSETAYAIARTDLSFYTFEAIRIGTHGDFHITSHRFDEPTAVGLVGRSWTAVSIHLRRNDGTDMVWLSGHATHLRDAGFEAELNERLSGLD